MKSQGLGLKRLDSASRLGFADLAGSNDTIMSQRVVGARLDKVQSEVARTVVEKIGFVFLKAI
jgi:hypothetical protein